MKKLVKRLKVTAFGVVTIEDYDMRVFGKGTSDKICAGITIKNGPYTYELAPDNQRATT